MKSKPKQRRPEVESLESMTLLSGVAAMVHPAAPQTLHLVGTLHGTFTSTRGAGPSSVTASGTLTPLGKVNFTGKLPTASLSATSGNVSLSNKQGKLLIGLNVVGLSGTYTINGGTKAYAGDTGTGSFSIALISAKNGKFTATFD
jgi:hypothetical protein